MRNTYWQETQTMAQPMDITRYTKKKGILPTSSWLNIGAQGVADVLQRSLYAL